MGATVEGLINVVNGTLLADYKNTAWGKPNDAAGFTLRYRMGGREYDATTGLYYMRARYYDPQSGRFMSEDPIGIEGGLNLYAYAGNNPINYRDPTGLGPECPPGYHKVTITDPETGKETERCALGDIVVQGTPPPSPERVGCGQNCGAGFDIPSIPTGYQPPVLEGAVTPYSGKGQRRFDPQLETDRAVCGQALDECAYQCGRFTRPQRRAQCFSDCMTDYARCLRAADDRARERKVKEVMDGANRWLDYILGFPGAVPGRAVPIRIPLGPRALPL